MAQHIQIRRNQFYDDVNAAYNDFLNRVAELAAEHNLDVEVAAEELDYLPAVKEMYETREGVAAK